MTAQARRSVTGDRCADKRGDAEVRAVRHPGQKARAHQGPVVGSDRAQHVAEHQHRSQADQEPSPRHPRNEYGDQRSAHHDAERVSADQMTGLGNRHAEVLGDLRQKPHRNELAGADSESTDREREDSPAQRDDSFCRVAEHPQVSSTRRGAGAPPPRRYHSASRGYSSVGRAFGSQSKGRRFESG